MLFSYKGPYHLSGGKALLAALAIVIVLGTWVGWASRFALLALPLFAALTFWPFVPEGPMDVKMKFFMPTLVVNLLAFPLLLKTRRKPFAKW
jgi:O-antigen ligase